MAIRHTSLIVSALTVGLTLAACGDGAVRISAREGGDSEAHGVLKVVETLQCPTIQGNLTRKGSAQNGGTVCVYAGPRGQEVTLQLVGLNGAAPEQALRAFEDSLSQSMPNAAASIRSASASAAEAEASAVAAAGDQVAVDAPGMAIRTQGEDKASVRLPGLSIDADGEKASVNIGGIHIKADDSRSLVAVADSSSGSSVQVESNADAARVRSSSGRGGATRIHWVLTDSDASAQGWRTVGYEARGPAGGPLVVATVRSRDANRDAVFEDARALVTLNVGR